MNKIIFNLLETIISLTFTLDSNKIIKIGIKIILYNAINLLLNMCYPSLLYALRQDLRLRAQARHAERKDWPRENRDPINVDDDDNWLTNRFRHELDELKWETSDGQSTIGGGTRRRRDSSGAPIPKCNCDESEPRMCEQREQYRLSIYGEVNCTSK